MKAIRNILGWLLVILFTACESCDFNPYYSSCGNGYYFDSDKSYGTDDLCYEYKKNPYKDTIITFHDTLGNIVNDTINTFYVATTVIDYNVDWFEYNDSIIVAMQKPKDKFYEMDTLYYLDEYNRFKAFDYYEYWIIKSNTNDVYGPLSLNQYHDYCKKLGVPDKLRLSFEKSNNNIFIDIVGGILAYLVICGILCSPIVILVLVIIKIRQRKG